jgi:hypothetical protein
MKIPLTESDQAAAKELYRKWFALHPAVKNPSDMNSKAKFDFAGSIGWENLRLMQRARKANVKTYGYPFPWTQADYWV